MKTWKFLQSLKCVSKASVVDLDHLALETS
jgi:hypothetical protein